jgi:sodium transport system permease protein
MTAWVAFVKELKDALRDRRTLFTVLLSSVLLGPVLVVALSVLVASLESGAESRVVVVDGAEHAPGLVNFLQRQTMQVVAPPSGVEARLRDGSYGQPVVRVPQDFEAAMLRGERPRLTLLVDSANRGAQAASGRVERALRAYAQERATLELALRGVSPSVLQPFAVQDEDLASTASRAAQLTGMLPFFVMMAVLYGAMAVALDTTAGERERGSLEPLLATSARHRDLVIGKWAAVAAMGMGVAVLSSASFLPSRWLVRSDLMQAMFRFGPGEAAAFLAVLLPFAAALSAVLMAVAIRCRSVKEAQASATVVVLLVSMTPLVTLFAQRSEAPWQRWVPGLAQSELMARVLRGEALQWSLLWPSLLVSALLAVLGLAYVVRSLKSAAVR